MEDLLNKIRESIWDLEALNVKRTNMLIAFSPLVKRILIQEIMVNYPFPKDSTLLTFEGIRCNAEWCDNEIIIYDREVSCYYPELIKRIVPFMPINNTSYLNSIPSKKTS